MWGASCDESLFPVSPVLTEELYSLELALQVIFYELGRAVFLKHPDL